MAVATGLETAAVEANRPWPETSDLPEIASWRTTQPVNTGRESVRQLKTGGGAMKDEGPAAMTRPQEQPT